MTAIALAIPASASAATITVGSSADASANDGACSLREAITAANTNASSGAAAGECAAGQTAPAVDQIQFSIPGAGPHTIALASQLPNVSEQVVIDGGTDTSPGPAPDEIRVDGGDLITTAFDVEDPGTQADGTVLRSLTIINFSHALDVAGVDGVVIDDNLVGTDSTGAAGLGGALGINVGHSEGATSSATQITGNVFASQTQIGIAINSEGSDGNVIAGNRIGTTPAGTSALPNGIGIRILGGADENTIGGAGAASRNLISGNTGAGISIQNTMPAVGESANSNLIAGNRIGTGIAGEAPVGNGEEGIELIGAVSDTGIEGNLISANADGIRLAGNGTTSPDPSATTVTGNLIGTDDDGLEALGNLNGGFAIDEVTSADVLADNVLGGTTGVSAGGGCAGDCNLIAANGDSPTDKAVLLDATDGSGTQVLGNHIGVDATGNAALGNAGVGVWTDLAGSGIAIGSPAAPNVIAASGADGVGVAGDSSGLQVQSNLIGTGADGATLLGNGGNGVVIGDVASSLSATGNLIGGTQAGEGNVITDSSLDGVRVRGLATGNSMLANSIRSNAGLGIEILGNSGVDANDTEDADDGPNEGQNYPVLRAAVAEAGSTTVAGSLASEPSTEYLIEVYALDTQDASGHGEGEAPLGTFTAMTDANGDASFAEGVPQAADPGAAVTATATELDEAGEPLSTSEFGPNVSEGCDVEGTPGDDPALAGSSADEVICGLAGDDVIDGGGGDDTVVGGEGTDEVDYTSASAEIDADLAAGEITGAGAGDDFVAGVEDLRGSDFDDVIAGDEAANFVFAGAGRDVIEGHDGADTLKGGGGGDTVKGGTGNDELLSQDGGDTLKGQEGNNDDLSAGPGKDSLSGGAGSSDDCNGGGNDDDASAPGCETTSSIP